MLALTIVLTTFGLYGRSLGLWWAFDDTAILLHAQKYGPLEYFGDPQAWRALIPYSLQPWLTLTYDIDLTLFGFTPSGFFAHHLLALAACGWLVQRIASRWVDEAWAMIGAVLFLVGVPVAAASQQLMVRHYIDGLAFYLLATWLVIRSLDGGHGVQRWVAALSFAVAASAKEVFLPLGLLPFLMPVGTVRDRLYAAWPWLIVIGLYVPWRYYMLGELVGGYSPKAGLAGLGPGEVLRAFAQVPSLLWTFPNVSLTGVGALGAIAWASVARRSARGGVWLIALILMLAAPLVPLIRYPGLGAGSERYFIVPWAALSLLCVLVAGAAWRGRHGGVRLALIGTIGAIAVPALVASQQVTIQLAPIQSAHRELGWAVVEGINSDVIVGPPGVSPWFINGLMTLRPAMGNAALAPIVAADESDWAGRSLTGKRGLRFNPSTNLMEAFELTEANLQDWRQRLSAAPLRVAIDYDPRSRVLRWELGSPVNGGFVLLTGGSGLPLSAKGAIRMDHRPIGCFRIRLDGDDGKVVYSPLLTWPLVRGDMAGSRVHWQGAGDLFRSEQLESHCGSSTAPS